MSSWHNSVMSAQSNKSVDTIVGVLSDTHGRLSNACFAALADCALIIHAGDIGDPHVLSTLKTLSPVVAVLGNNDFDEYGKDVGRIAKYEFEGVRFFVEHYPEQVDLKGWGAKYFEAGEPLPQVCIHGHTHIPHKETGKLASPAGVVLCPGSASYPRGGSLPSVAKIALGEGRVKEVWFEEV